MYVCTKFGNYASCHDHTSYEIMQVVMIITTLNIAAFVLHTNLVSLV